MCTDDSTLHETKKPTIDQEFEQYFSTLMLWQNDVETQNIYEEMYVHRTVLVLFWFLSTLKKRSIQSD